MLAEANQSEGTHEMEFDVYQITVFSLYRSANWNCPKCGKIDVCFSLVLQFTAFSILS